MTDHTTEPHVRSGGCQCGALRYELRGAPIDLYACHCRECRKQSASAFGITVMVRSTDVVLVKGDFKIWSRPADSGGTIDCAFCPTCGTRIWHGNIAEETEIGIKGGSLDSPIDMSGAKQIWVSRKVPGIVFADEAVQFDEEPI